MTATVVVTTRNRKAELRQCLESVLRQSEAPEILVVDDASDDGTIEMLKAEFASVRIVRHDRPLGYIVGRNEGARLAQGEVIISLDDDAAFSDPHIVRDTLASFSDDRIAGVAIPYIDVNRDATIRQSAPDRTRVYLSAIFIGTAHAVRRRAFLACGGYREALFHQGEESDLCIRLLDAGYVIRLGSSEPIHHYESPRRDFRRMDHFGPRNAILFAWQNVPLDALLMQLPRTIAGLIVHSWQPKRLVVRLGGIVDGLWSCARTERRPVARSTYRLWRRLQTSASPVCLPDVAGELPARA